MKNEDVIFSSAVQIINQQTSAEDINRCLELIRFPHTSIDFLVNVILDHQLMKDPPRDRYPREALLYQVKKHLHRKLNHLGTGGDQGYITSARITVCINMYPRLVIMNV